MAGIKRPIEDSDDEKSDEEGELVVDEVCSITDWAESSSVLQSIS